MKLVTLLSERRVVPEIQAATQWEALAELIDHLVSTGHIQGGSRDAILEALQEREEQVSTGIGHGVAIPHAYCDCLEQPLAILGRSAEGLEFEACDNAPVHFVVLLILPRSQSNQHLQTLAGIAGLFSQCEVRRKVKEAGTADEIMGVLGSCDAEAA